MPTEFESWKNVGSNSVHWSNNYYCDS